jgi:hypothetical protein
MCQTVDLIPSSTNNKKKKKAEESCIMLTQIKTALVPILM